MAHQFAALAFTESVKQMQIDNGSRAGYAAMDDGPDYNHALTAREAAFIEARDSFYMASVSETGWPYVQHRGGPKGFMRVLDERTLGFADFSGNRQYVSLGNVRKDDRVSLFFMDYPNRTRLKLLGRVEIVGGDDSDRLAALEMDDYRANVERGFIIHVEAFDWNCPQHITPRFSEDEVATMMAPLVEENRRAKGAAARGARNAQSDIGDGPIPLTVTGVRALTPSIRAYRLTNPRGQLLPEFDAGAHLEVPVTLADGTRTLRHYSITSDPTRRDAYEIAVLRDDDGRGGSAAVHDAFQIGLALRMQPPRNHFALHTDERPALLIAGGIGITPIKAMAHTLVRRDTPFTLHYAAQREADLAYRHDLAELAGDALRLYRSDRDERIDLEDILRNAPDDAIVYVCGPQRLIDGVVDAARALAMTDRIRSERFSVSADGPSHPIQVELARSGTTLDVAADESVLDALLNAGVDAPYSCRTGVCGSCTVKVLAGEPEHRDAVLSDVQKDTLGLMCPCVSRASGDRLRLDL